MSKDFCFMFYPGEYLRDTQCLSEKTQVAYDRIMCEHMRNICITQQQLNFFTKKLSPDELNELMFILNKSNGGFEIEWVAKSIRERNAYSESRRKNREGKPKEDINIISKSYDSHMVGIDKDEVKYKDLLKKVIAENEISLPEGFEPLILEWLKYKSEKGQSYKETGLKTLIKTFLKDSNSDLKIGREMLDYSMSKNYTGLFKNNNNGLDRQHSGRHEKDVNAMWH